MLNFVHTILLAGQISNFAQFLTTPMGVLTALLISTVIGLIGILVGWIPLKSKKPSYLIRSFTLISSPQAMPEGLEIYYSGEAVEQLTISRVLFLNAGKEVINREDIAPKHPLKIILASSRKSFSKSVLYAKNENGFGIKESNDDILIEFDYLAKNEGGVVQIVHSGSEKDIKLIGTVKGINKFSKMNKIWFESDNTEMVYSIASFAIASLFLVLTIVISENLMYPTVSAKGSLHQTIFVTSVILLMFFNFLMVGFIGKISSPAVKEYSKYMNQEWTV